MKKYIFLLTRLICFCIVIVLFLGYLSYISKAPKLNDYLSRNEYWQTMRAEDDNTIDIMFVGDSSFTASVIPIQIWEKEKITSYILGYTFMHPSEAYHELKKTFDSQKPKCVFLEVSFLAEYVSDTDKRSQLAIDKTNSFIKYLDEEINSSLYELFPYFKYKSSLEDMALSDYIAKRPVALNNFYKGCNYFYTVKPFDYKQSSYLYTSNDKAVFSDSAEEYFDKIYKLCKKNQTELVMVYVPQIADWSMKKHDLLNSLSIKYDVPFVDYNIDTETKIEGFSWNTDTRDGGVHLNCFGAEKFTKAICQYMKDELNLKQTQLTDSQILKWNDDAKLFYDTVNSDEYKANKY